MQAELGRCVASWFPGATGIAAAAKLSGGASQETWSFDIVHPGGNVGAILRRAPQGYGAAPGRAAGLDAEATLMQLAHDAGLPSPKVMHVLRPQDELGTGFVIQRIEGETIARKILRDEQFAKARSLLARQLGGAVAGIHALDKAKLPKLRTSIASSEIADLEREYRGFDWPRPVSNWRCAGCASAIPVRRRSLRWCMAISGMAISSSAPAACARCWTGISPISAR